MTSHLARVFFMKILLLEDDIALNKAIQRVLELDHHKVSPFFDGQDIIDAMAHRYDLYILDINVPNISGLELLDAILLQNQHAKVMMISANTDLLSLQTAYDKGCVDYIKKPFHIAELRAKIKRLQIHREEYYSTVRLKENAEPLTKKEKRLINLLLDNAGEIVTYEMIDDYVYESKAMTMDALRTLVRRLRSKLADDIIHNAIDEGYMIHAHDENSNTDEEESILTRLETLEKENERLRKEKKLLLQRSTTDPLTGLYNRVKIQEIFQKEQQAFISHREELSVILMDLDNFKSINDSYGHNIGDKYLQELAQTLKNAFRSGDIVGRWGGEEFIILLPQTSLETAQEIAKRIKKMIQTMECPLVGERTASFGLTSLREHDTLTAFVKRADEALLLAKKSGKNRVEVYKD